jgi:hypothetical protein
VVTGVGFAPKADDSNRISFRLDSPSLRAPGDRALAAAVEEEKTSPKRGLQT